MCLPAAPLAAAAAFMAQPAVLAATAIAATGVTMLGQRNAAAAQSNMANYEAQIADRNRALAVGQANDAVARGDKEAQAQGRRIAMLRGSQMAQMSAQGLDLSYGSPKDILTDTTVLGNQDQQTIRENAQREARGYEISASNYEASAAASRTAASNAKSAGRTAMFSTLLGNAVKFGSSMANFGGGGGALSPFDPISAGPTPASIPRNASFLPLPRL